MSSIIIDIADALVTSLNDAPGGTFSQAVTAERKYAPSFEIKDMKTLHVTVVPKEFDEERASRGALQSDYMIDIAIQKRLSTTITNTEPDALMVLVNEIAEFLRNIGKWTLASGAGVAKWRKTKNAPIYAPSHLREFRQFTSLLKLTFSLMRSE